MSWSGPGRQTDDLCACRQPELRQNHAVQRADRLESACGQLPRRYGGPEGGGRQKPEGLPCGGPARHLLHPPLHAGRNCHPGFCTERKAGRHHQHCGRNQHRAQPVPDASAALAAHPHGGGAEHDGRGAQQRRLGGRAEDERGAGRAGGAHQRRQERGDLRTDRPDGGCGAQENPALGAGFLPGGAGAPLHSRGVAHDRGPCGAERGLPALLRNQDHRGGRVLCRTAGAEPQRAGADRAQHHRNGA